MNSCLKSFSMSCAQYERTSPSARQVGLVHYGKYYRSIGKIVRYSANLDTTALNMRSLSLTRGFRASYKYDADFGLTTNTTRGVAAACALTSANVVEPVGCLDKPSAYEVKQQLLFRARSDLNIQRRPSRHLVGYSS